MLGCRRAKWLLLTWGAILSIVAPAEVAGAVSLVPTDIVANWTVHPEAKNEILFPGTFAWGVDATLQKVPYVAITNHPNRIGGSSATDTERYSSLVSNFSSAGNFSFGSSFFMPNDADVAGFLWGYQDTYNHYRLSWDRNNPVKIAVNPSAPSGFDNGNYEGGRGFYLVKEVAGVSTVLFQNNSLFWSRNTIYDFSVVRVGSDLTVSIFQGGNLVVGQTIADNTFTSGRVGFNTAGVEVLYGNAQFSEDAVPVPVPGAAVGLLCFGLLAAYKIIRTSGVGGS